MGQRVLCSTFPSPFLSCPASLQPSDAGRPIRVKGVLLSPLAKPPSDDDFTVSLETAVWGRWGGSLGEIWRGTEAGAGRERSGVVLKRGRERQERSCAERGRQRAQGVGRD